MRELETAEQGANRGATSFKSCARQLDLPLEVIVRAAETGRLGRLIEQRSGRQAERRNLARIDSMYRRLELAAKPRW
jgi:hypothetical protein